MLKIKRLMQKHVPGMMTCEAIDNFLYDYHEGNLSYFESVKFRLHLSMCKECQAYVLGYKNTIRISQDNFIVPEPIENIPEKLIQAILDIRANK